MNMKCEWLKFGNRSRVERTLDPGLSVKASTLESGALDLNSGSATFELHGLTSLYLPARVVRRIKKVNICKVFKAICAM